MSLRGLSLNLPPRGPRPRALPGLCDGRPCKAAGSVRRCTRQRSSRASRPARLSLPGQCVCVCEYARTCMCTHTCTCVCLCVMCAHVCVCVWGSGQGVSRTAVAGSGSINTRPLRPLQWQRCGQAPRSSRGPPSGASDTAPRAPSHGSGRQDPVRSAAELSVRGLGRTSLEAPPCPGGSGCRARSLQWTGPPRDAERARPARLGLLLPLGAARPGPRTLGHGLGAAGRRLSQPRLCAGLGPCGSTWRQDADRGKWR